MFFFNFTHMTFSRLLSLSLFLVLGSNSFAQIQITPASDLGFFDQGQSLTFNFTGAFSGTTAEYTYAHIANSGLPNVASGTIPVNGGSGSTTYFPNTPGVYRCQVTQNNVGGTGTALAGLNAIAPTDAEPADFDQFWINQKATLAGVPMNTQISFYSNTTYTNTYKLILDVSSSAKAYCYITVPIAAGPFPAILQLPAFGNTANLVNPNVELCTRGGALVVNINIHNNDPSQPGPNSYTTMGSSNAETVYYKHALLSIFRVIDYLQTRSDFNQQVGIIGDSQGGGLAILGAGLDSRISLLAVVNPALCNHGGFGSGKPSGFPYYQQYAVNLGFNLQQVKDAVRYYDAAFAAKRFKGKTMFMVGLQDEVCPPVTGLAAYNQLQGNKELMLFRNSGHSPNPSEFADPNNTYGIMAWMRRYFPAMLNAPWPYPTALTTAYGLSAGNDATIGVGSTTLQAVADLNGATSNAWAIEWFTISGPGSVSISSPNAYTTNANFTTQGVYRMGCRIKVPEYNNISSGGYIYLQSERTITVGTVSGLTTTISTSVPSPISAGQTVTLTASASQGANFQWSNGQTGSSITVSPNATTNYCVTATSTSNGATASACQTMVVNNNMSVTVTSSSSGTVSPGSAVTLTASSNQASSFQWSTGQWGSSITIYPSSTADYCVTATANNGAGTATTCKSVSVSGGITPVITSSAGTGTVTPGQTVTLTATAGVSASFYWSTGQWGPSITVNPNTTATYCVTATPSVGGVTGTACQVVTVTSNFTATLTSSNGTATVTPGQTVTLTASASSDAAFYWSTGQWGPSITVNPNATATYCVTATSSTNGFLTATSCKSITVSSGVTATITSSAGTGAVTPGQTVTLTASSNVAASFFWSNGQWGPSITVTPSATTSYCVTATASSGAGATVSTCQAIVVTSSYSATITSTNGSATVTPGQTVTLTVTANQSSAFLWSNGIWGSSITVNPSATTTYCVTATSQGPQAITTSTCKSITVATPVSVVVTSSNGSTSINPGQTVTLTATANVGVSYLWSNGQTSATISVNPNATTTYCVTVTSFGTSPTTSNACKIVPVLAPTVTISSSNGNNNVNAGTAVALTAATNAAAATFVWSTGQTGSSIVVYPNSTTNYCVTVTTTGSGVVSANVCKSITVNATLTATITPSITTPVTPGQTVTLTASASTGATFVWSNGQTSTSISVNPAVTTTYCVTATSTSNGLTATSCKSVTVSASYAATISSSVGGSTITAGQPVTLTASANQTSVFYWSTGQWGPSITVYPNATATYCVTATSEVGQPITTTACASVPVANSLLPVITSSAGNTTIAPGQTVTLTASASQASSFYWSTGQWGPSITVTPSATTTYCVTATTEMGQAITASTCKSVPVSSTMTTTINASSSAITAGQSVTLTATSTTGATYFWSNGQWGASIIVNPTQTSTYCVTATANVGGSTSTSCKAITVAAVSCTNLSVYNITNITCNSMTVSWSAVANVTQYRLRYRQTNISEWSYLAWSTDITKTLTGLSASTSYYVQIQTQCSNGTTAFSPRKTVQTTACLIISGGGSSNLEISGSNLGEAIGDIIAYPNPTRNIVFLDFTQISTEEPVVCNLTDLTGRILESKTTFGGEMIEFQLENIISGMYLIELQSPQGHATQRVVKL
jgi:cephalosporin-C deacetylase-like acetyl esterase